MSTNVSHRLPTPQAHAIADLTGYEDADTLRWQQVCTQVAQRLTALPHGRFAYMTLERVRQGLDLAQRGCVTLAEDPNELTAEVRSGSAHYRVNLAVPSCQCTDFQKRKQTCKHLFSTEVHIGALALFRSTAPEAALDGPAAESDACEAAHEAAPLEPTGPEALPPAPGTDARPPVPTTATWPISEAPASLNIKLRVGNMDLMYTMRDVDDLKLQRRATLSLPWLTDVLHGCEANLAARQQAEEERKAQARSLDEQIAATVAAALKAQAEVGTNGPRKPPTAPTLEPTNDTDPSWCPIHHVPMQRRSNERGSWYSHRLSSGAYCKGE